MNFDLFQKIVEEEIAKIPELYKQGVRNFFADPRVIRHPSRIPGLYILGHFHTNKDNLGRSVTLYYGSFRKIFRSKEKTVWRREIAATLLHELLHHWEHESGYDQLGKEDRARIDSIKLRSQGLFWDTRANFFEVILFLISFFILVTLASILTSS